MCNPSILHFFQLQSISRFSNQYILYEGIWLDSGLQEFLNVNELKHPVLYPGNSRAGKDGESKTWRAPNKEGASDC